MKKLQTALPKPIKRADDCWWIPRCPPHYFQSLGPYDTKAEAEEDRRGIYRCISTPEWRAVLKEIEKEDSDL